MGATQLHECHTQHTSLLTPPRAHSLLHGGGGLGVLKGLPEDVARVDLRHIPRVTGDLLRRRFPRHGQRRRVRRQRLARPAPCQDLRLDTQMQRSGTGVFAARG